MSRELMKVLRSLPTTERRFKVAVAVQGRTISDVCHEAGVSNSVLSRDLHGYESMRDEHKARLSTVLGVPVDVLWAA